MSSLSQVIKRTLAISAGAFMVTVPPALAQGDGRLPPPPLPVPTSGAVPPPGSGAMPAPPAAAPVAPPTDVSTLKVEPGCCEDQRKVLLGRIMDAKNAGIGTSTYMMAFDGIEQQVKGGDKEENVLKRIGSITTSLDEQFKRSAILKTQRPSPPIAASDPSVPYGSSGGGGGMGKNTDTASLIQKLQNKYGSQIPDNMKGALGGSDPSSLLKNPEIQDMLKKYGK